MTNGLTYPPSGEADVLLRDGTVAAIRRAQPSDADGLLALHRNATDRTLRLRFFAPSRAAAESYAMRLTSDASRDAITLVAELRDEIVAMAIAVPTDEATAEIAFLVADAAQGLGIGSLLLEHLAAAARAAGIRHFTADVLADNGTMGAVFRAAGFDTTGNSARGVTVFDISTEATPAAVAAADQREFTSERRSLRPLLYPRSVAIVGVRRSGGGVGSGVLDSILRAGFTGEICVIHPSASRIAGVRCFPSVVDVPGQVDLYVIAVPAEQVLSVLQDAAVAHVPAAVVITSGFGELGAAGRQLQSAIQRTAREHSIRLVGPNCLGLLSNHPDVRLNATFSRVVPPAGGLAIASQSGGVGIALLDLAAHAGLGVTSFVSLGNKADVSGNDLLAAWYDDVNVTGAALYLESFGNARKFARIARRFAERKPLLAVVGGRSSGGVRAGASHTAAAAAPAVGVDALFATAGVIACHSAEEMAYTALLLQQQPLPRGRRVGIVSNAGGVGVLAADAADAAGLVVPELSEGLRATLQKHVSGTAGTSNPVDLGAGADATTLANVVGPLAGSGEVDTVIVALVDTSVTDAAPMLDALDNVRSKHETLPMVLVAMGGLDARPGQAVGLTRYAYPDDAIVAIRHAAAYAEWLARPRTEAPPIDAERSRAARAVVGEVLATAPASGAWVPPALASRLLEPYGLQPEGVVVRGPSMAGEAASVLGFPVAVKVADEHVVHKTERGLVRVGLDSAQAVAAAVRDFAAEIGDGADVPVLVQPMVNGVEVALGVVRDPGFGPLVMVAAGGVATGVWNDRVFLLPPVTPSDAARALRSLRIWPLLAGYRGTAPADSDHLECVIVALGELAREVPELAELDLNPVVAAPTGVSLVDVKIRVTPADRDDDGVPRQLRT